MASIPDLHDAGIYNYGPEAIKPRTDLGCSPSVYERRKRGTSCVKLSETFPLDRGPAPRFMTSQIFHPDCHVRLDDGTYIATHFANVRKIYAALGGLCSPSPAGGRGTSYCTCVRVLYSQPVLG